MNELEHEASKFRSYLELVLPDTVIQTLTVEEVLTGFLRENIPETTESFFTVVDGVADRRSRHPEPARLDRDTEFMRLVREAEEPVSGRWAGSDGPIAYAVLPIEIEGGGGDGALVILEHLGPELREALGTITVMSLVALLALVFATWLAWAITGRILTPLTELRLTAERIGASDFSARIEVRGTDDVSRLAATFNTMLDRLENAFAQQRQFLDDIGHELRTPITIVRGHLELMGDDPSEREQTLGLVEDELQRMSRLVNDLILLARSGKPGLIQRGETHVEDLVVETLAKATALGERTWRIDASEPAVVRVDRQRLTQALLQLAANAVAHTRAGDTITIGGALQHPEASGAAPAQHPPAELRLWVSDTGRGIAPEDVERIFDRFERGGTRREGSSGLGLAIVRAIAQAHGGTVQVESELGLGSTFTLVIPASEEENA